MTFYLRKRKGGEYDFQTHAGFCQGCKWTAIKPFIVWRLQQIKALWLVIDDDLADRSEMNSDGSINIPVPQRNGHIYISDMDKNNGPSLVCFRQGSDTSNDKNQE